MEENSNNINISKEKPFFCEEEVGKRGYFPIEVRFNTLINDKGDAPFDWYKNLGIDKSDASKIRRGVIIPPEWLRIKISKYFGTDSSTIWKIPEIISADKINQGDENGK